jgi:hypothetical protein
VSAEPVMGAIALFYWYDMGDRTKIGLSYLEVANDSGISPKGDGSSTL